jgi:drug/metabolite transporter superfamily protein YnfA
VAIVRLLLFAALAVIAGALVLYAVKRDRRYLRFIVQVAKYTVIVLLAILLAFAAQRLFGISFGGAFSASASPPLPARERLFERTVRQAVGEIEQRGGSFSI